MRLATFRSNKGLRAGVVVKEEYVIDLEKAAAFYGETLPNEVKALLELGENAIKTTEKVIALVEGNLEQAIHSKLTQPLSETSLFAPVPKPDKIICVGLNYKDHAEESNMEIPQYPMLFSKYSNTVNGPYDNIVLPKVSENIDYEAELAVVIGKTGRYISEENALDYVAGYTVINDVSVRDYQFHSPQFSLGKNFDTHGPMGPWLVTKDEIEDPHNLNIELKIGDQVLQSSNTKELIFPIQRIISYISEGITLDPGDVIATGTPAGVGFGRNPKLYLRDGDEVIVTIEGIGEIKNKAVKEN
ncbi:fumarylacetoacetate hydrolase family protein [Bacillus sp. B15-48]|uniref:fumarylacetoacetate hydrolase family protein n=1 Tax=Bacillus sp. B15-48 TaxID=1548601 RepID=UPI00193F6731|nr:fumarylacetoacetate hydrolase family protein [Bacillus sp. B15-48]MBM4764810.1 hypothetical protein [Bacillus sp. B15-48]